MTERKPPGTSWETWVEAQIRVAREQGAFDNLPGAGKPLPNLDLGNDPLWWVKQFVQRERISMLPPSLELLRKVGEGTRRDRGTARRSGRPGADRRAQCRDRQGQRDRGGRAADAPRRVGCRSGGGAVAASPLRRSSV